LSTEDEDDRGYMTYEGAQEQAPLNADDFGLDDDDAHLDEDDMDLENLNNIVNGFKSFIDTESGVDGVVFKRYVLHAHS